MTAPQIALSALDASWSGTIWPPEAASQGDVGISFEGVVVGTARRLECRRSDVQKGYLASKKTADLSAKYTEFSVKVDRGTLAELKSNCAAGKFFESVGGGESRFFTGGDVIKLWGPPTVVAELAAIMQVSDPLSEGDRVKVYTLAGTMLVRSLEIVTLAKRKGKTMSIMGETHMYGVVQGGPVQVDAKGGLTDKIFAAKAGMPSGKAEAKPQPGGGEVADEEWDS